MHLSTWSRWPTPAHAEASPTLKIVGGTAVPKQRRWWSRSSSAVHTEPETYADRGGTQAEEGARFHHASGGNSWPGGRGAELLCEGSSSQVESWGPLLRDMRIDPMRARAPRTGGARAVEKNSGDVLLLRPERASQAWSEVRLSSSLQDDPPSLVEDPHVTEQARI